MATLLLNGTQLEPHAPRVPLNKPFLFSIAALYLVAMHIFMPNSGGEGLLLPSNATSWLFLGLSIALGLYQIASHQYIRYSKLTIGLWMCCVLMTIPIFFSNASFENSAERLIGLWAGFTLFLVLQQFYFSNKSKQKLLWFVVCAVVIEAIIGSFQYINISTNGLFYSASIPYGIFQHTETMASFLATGVVLSGYLLARQPKIYSKKLREVGLLYFTPVITLPLIVLLDSEIGWITSAIAILTLLPYLYRFSPRQRFFNWIMACSIGLVIGLAALFLQNENAEHSYAEKQVAPNRTLFSQSIDMLIEKPFTGYGFGHFESQYILYTARQHQLNNSYPSGIPSTQHPNNEILFWGVEGGGLPVLGQLLAIIFVLARIYSAKEKTRLVMFALLLPIAMQGQFSTPFYQSSIHWLTFIILLFWVEQRVAKCRVFRFSEFTRSVLRVTSLTMPVAISIYIAGILHTNYYLTKFEVSNPKQLDILNKIINPALVKDRLDWDLYSAYFEQGLSEEKSEYFQPYIDWSLKTIQSKPRPELYINLIKAYQVMGNLSRAEQTKTEATFLFPNLDFSDIHYPPFIENQEDMDSDDE
ncbi:PglL family O-oligosaccharyltransferase [Vibrio ziniensis]|uniref:Ligase n=1 Tax=Vibrio ziniensis TaxID=2711221 RepID=A0A6G7CL90_9VIBR|nr:PglL family O-oligosaccharyltransferase [Vibrio ziniensis]QIH42844.1 ligase [Vibrio ziniensis]